MTSFVAKFALVAAVLACCLLSFNFGGDVVAAQAQAEAQIQAAKSIENIKKSYQLGYNQGILDATSKLKKERT